MAAPLAVAVVGAGLVYRHQIVSYVTHLKGGPGQTWAYEPFPPSARPEIRLAVVGDVGEPGDRIDETVRAVAHLGGDDPYDALVVLGDNVYPSGDPERLGERVFGPFSGVLDRGARLLAILGNHDVKDDHADGQVAALGMPGRWYATELPGDVLFVALDSTLADDAGQQAWLEKTLAGSDARWKIAAVHHPPYSAGYQGSSSETRAAFSPLFERYGVSLVLSGHDHDYQRSKVIRGVTYVVSGGASATRRTGERSFTAFSASSHHFVEVDVFPDHLLVRAVRPDELVFDEATIPTTRPRPAASPGG